MTAATEIVGSWFPSGYHGHFRSKSRNDFVCEYRQLAKPIPPKRFLNRSRQPSARHVFSHHDNREAFQNDAILFTQGLGKKRTPGRAYIFNPDFMTWMPEKEYIERSRPLISSYTVDYRQQIIAPQIIVKRPKTSFDGVPTTSYRYSHGTSAPNKETINAANNDALKLSLLNRKNRAMSAKVSKGRESVASCLIWHDPARERERKLAEQQAVAKSMVPPATETVVYEPHPPPTREPTSQVIQTAPVQPPPAVTAVPPAAQSGNVTWPQPNPVVTAQPEANGAQRPKTAVVRAPPSYGAKKARSLSARPAREKETVATSLIWHDMWKSQNSDPVYISYDPHLPPSQQAAKQNGTSNATQRPQTAYVRSAAAPGNGSVQTRATSARPVKEKEKVTVGMSLIWHDMLKANQPSYVPCGQSVQSAPQLYMREDKIAA